MVHCYGRCLDSCQKEVKDVFNAQQVLFAERLAASDLKNVLLDENANFPRGGFKPQKRHYDNDAFSFRYIF